MKKIVMLLFTILLISGLSGCCLSHNWDAATCTEPQKCSKCGKTQGEPLGHSWIEADCTTAKTCSVCNEVDGKPLGHEWQEATCTSPAKCVRCSTQQGLRKNHNYVQAEVLVNSTCSQEGSAIFKCTLCGEKVTKNIGVIKHNYREQTSGCKTTKTCKDCNYTITLLNHAEWRFTSNYYITSCDYTSKTFYGTVACSKCGKTKDGSKKYSSEDFEKTFCSWVNYGSYDDIARYPEDNRNYVMKFSGYILQDCGNNQYRMSTNGKYKNVILVDFIGTKNGRILEDDYVTVYGKPNLLHTYTSVLGEKITIPKFTAYYIH